MSSSFVSSSSSSSSSLYIQLLRLSATIALFVAFGSSSGGDDYNFGWIRVCNGFVIGVPLFVPVVDYSVSMQTNVRKQQKLALKWTHQPKKQFIQQQSVRISTTQFMSSEGENNVDEDSTNKPFGVIVKTEIHPDRMAEFLQLIEKNAIETRKEPDCIRFDVLRCQESPNQFFFYELYKNIYAIEHHKQQVHYKAWATFKETGGTIDSITYKMDGEFVVL